MTVTLSSRFDGALAYARRLHAGQARKGTAIPYVAHLLAVTAIVLEHGGREDEAIAALLHDAVEDQGGSGAGAGVGPVAAVAIRRGVRCSRPDRSLYCRSWSNVTRRDAAGAGRPVPIVR